jgi:hypothetical protein
LLEAKYKISSTAWANAGKHLNEHGVAAPRPAQKKREIPQNVINKIKDYFYNDEITFNSSYRTIIKSVRDPNSPKEFLRDENTGKIRKEPINVRFLNNVSRSFVWNKFIAENPDAPIKRSKFFELIPQEIKDGRRETDKCPVCFYGKKIDSELITIEKRVHAECMNCDTINCQVETDLADDIKQELKVLRDNLVVYQQHIKDKTSQRTAIKTNMESLMPGEALAILDFKANMKVNQHNVQLNHEFYLQHSRSLLGVAIVLPKVVSQEKGIHNIVYFDLLSDNLNHNAHFVITGLKSVLEHEFIVNLNLKKLTVWMDGAGHFKNSQLAKYFSDVELETQLALRWNYFTEYHGKALCDARFANITRFVNQELQSKNGSIETTDDIIRVIQKGQEDSNQLRVARKKLPIKSVQMSIEIPVIDSIDSYVIKNIKTFHSFTSENGIISSSVNSNDPASTVHPRKLEQIAMTGAIRRGYQTQVFNVDTLFSGLHDKQAKQIHFRNGGSLKKAPKSKRKSKTINDTLSQPISNSNIEYDPFDFYSQGSAVSDDEMPRESAHEEEEISPQISLAEPSSTIPIIEEVVNSSELTTLPPVVQQIYTMVNSGQISDLRSYLSTYFGSACSILPSNASNTAINIELGPLTRVLNRVM